MSDDHTEVTFDLSNIDFDSIMYIRQAELKMTYVNNYDVPDQALTFERQAIVNCNFASALQYVGGAFKTTLYVNPYKDEYAGYVNKAQMYWAKDNPTGFHFYVDFTDKILTIKWNYKDVKIYYQDGSWNSNEYKAVATFGPSGIAYTPYMPDGTGLLMDYDAY